MTPSIPIDDSPSAVKKYALTVSEWKIKSKCARAAVGSEVQGIKHRKSVCASSTSEQSRTIPDAVLLSRIVL